MVGRSPVGALVIRGDLALRNIPLLWVERICQRVTVGIDGGSWARTGEEGLR